ncbi:hypothetical protein J3F84DRAFT_123581 [Trichoderma pleuroticola]
MLHYWIAFIHSALFCPIWGATSLLAPTSPPPTDTRPCLYPWKTKGYGAVRSIQTRYKRHSRRCHMPLIPPSL